MSPRCLLWVMQPYVFTRCARVCHLSIGCRFSDSWTRKSTNRFDLVVKMILTCWEMLILNQLSHQNPSTEQDPDTVAKQAKHLGAKLVHVAGCLGLCLFLSWSKHFRHKTVWPTSFRKNAFSWLVGRITDLGGTKSWPLVESLKTLLRSFEYANKYPLGFCPRSCLVNVKGLEKVTEAACLPAPQA